MTGIYAHEVAQLLFAAISSGSITKYITELTEFKGLIGNYPKGPSNEFSIPAELREITADGSLRIRN